MALTLRWRDGANVPCCYGSSTSIAELGPFRQNSNLKVIVPKLLVSYLDMLRAPIAAFPKPSSGFESDKTEQFFSCSDRSTWHCTDALPTRTFRSAARCGKWMRGGLVNLPCRGLVESSSTNCSLLKEPSGDPGFDVEQTMSNIRSTIAPGVDGLQELTPSTIPCTFSYVV